MDAISKNNKVYVLLLKDQKYYVGCTVDVQRRFQEHKNGQGSSWTHKYPPIKILEQKPGTYTDENILTKQYMARYGIKNVRGGIHCRTYLHPSEKKLLEKEMRSVKNACYKCGLVGHYANVCGFSVCKRCRKKGHIAEKCMSVYCYRCGRTSHTFDKCYAKTHLNGENMHNCYRCGRSGHLRMDCTEKTDVFGVVLVGPSLFGRFTSWIRSFV